MIISCANFLKDSSNNTNSIHFWNGPYMTPGFSNLKNISRTLLVYSLNRIHQRLQMMPETIWGF